MFAVVHVPDFALQAVLRFEPLLHKQPVALIDASLPKSPVIQLTQAARDQWVTEGLTPTQARARCLSLVIKSRSATMEQTATAALLQCAHDFSPDIEATAEGVVTLDLKGFRSLALEDYAPKIVERVRWLNLDARVGVAGNPLLALYAARQAKPVLVLSEEVANGESASQSQSPATFLECLPIEAIGPSLETGRILKQWGIRTLGNFIKLGEEAVSERLGAEGKSLFERATVRKTRPLRLVYPEEKFEEAIEFEHEIETAEPLLSVLRRFVEQIAIRISMAGKVVETLVLRLNFSRGPDYEHVFKVPEPTARDDVLFRMLDTHLENFKSEHSIVGLHLSVTPCLGRDRQFGLFESSLRDPNHFSETLAQLSVVVGVSRLGTPAIKLTHRPDAFDMKPLDFERRAEREDSTMSAPPMEDWRGKTGLPLRRFRPPLAAEVELNGAQPIRFRTSKFSGAIHDARGPWRTSGDWWDNQSWARDEWDVATVDGALYRLFMEGDRWFVEGIYD